ncbi:MAG: thiolase family protein [Acidimicrobiia bacterium]|nr:thiolase family protein [Acidimicrobiia bacterium]
MSREVFIVEAVRTPIGRGKADGALHAVHPVDLLAHTLDAVISRAGIDKALVEDVVAGCVTPVAEQGADIARFAALKAGFPIEVPGVQLNRFCGSGQQAVHFAAQEIASGDMDLVIACGVEMMSRVPIGSDADLRTQYFREFPHDIVHQGISAELVAAKYKLSRQELDGYAARSHCRAVAAERNGWTKAEIAPVKVGEQTVTCDEGVRANPDLSRMAALPPAFQADGVITAANSSQISDGAGALLLASAKKADALGLRKRARILTRVVTGSDPVLMLTGPIEASRMALRRAGLSIADIGAIEINEAFASVPLAWARELQPDTERLNMQGGAIAHGHPLGATGAILMTKLVNIMERTGVRYGLQSMCIGFGMATATILENPSA